MRRHCTYKISTSWALPDVRRPSEDASYLQLPLVTSFYQFEVGFEWLPQASVEKQNRDFYGSACGFRRATFYDSSLRILLTIDTKGRIVKLGGGGSTLSWRETRRCRLQPRFCPKGRHGTIRPTLLAASVLVNILYHDALICSRVLVMDTAMVSSTAGGKHELIYNNWDKQKSLPRVFFHSPPRRTRSLVSWESPRGGVRSTEVYLAWYKHRWVLILSSLYMATYKRPSISANWPLK